MCSFVGSVPQVSTPLVYRLEVGDSQSDRYKVGVYEKPTVAGVDVTYQFPPYIDRAPESRKQQHADLEAPAATRAELRIHPSAPIAHGHILFGGEKIAGRITDSGKTLIAEMLLKESSTYTIHLFTDGEHTDPEPRVNRIKVTPDAPPTVQIVEPAARAAWPRARRRPSSSRRATITG